MLENEDSGPRTSSKEKRLKILAQDEIDSIYSRPDFTHEERVEYFALSQLEQELLEVFRSVKSQIYFILQLGYFKAKHLFFQFTLDEVEHDICWILAQHFNRQQREVIKVIDKKTRLKQQRLILKLHSYRSCGASERHQLEIKANQAAMVCSKPLYILREIINYLTVQQIVIPGYSFIQDAVSKSLNDEQSRLINIIHSHLKSSEVEALKNLLSDSTVSLHVISQLKREPKDFGVKEIKYEIHRGEQLRFLYHLANQLLPKLGISNESVKYYASLVGYYSVNRLKRLNEWTVYIYLLCFAYHRYQQLHDNLINCLIYRVRQYLDEAKDAAKERLYEYQISSNENLRKAGHVLKLFTDDKILEDLPFQKVQSTAFSILSRQKLSLVADQLANNASFDETAFQWEYVDGLSRQFKLNLRIVLQIVEFAATSSSEPLIEAVNFLKAAFKRGKPLKNLRTESFPIKWIPDAVKGYLYTHNGQQQKHLLPDRYEFLVYRLLRNGLEAGNIFCRDSVRFRSLEDDLISEQLWQSKTKLIVDSNLSVLTQPIEQHLITLEQILEERIAEVNCRIASGDNEHFQVQKRGKQVRWNLVYPAGTDLVNSPFFDVLDQLDIGELLHFVNQHCQFIQSFEHVLGRYQKQSLDQRSMVACLIAWGTNTGISRMGEISDIDYHLLASTSDNFIRQETLTEANDLISNAIAKLPIFHHYDLDNTIHSSSDGQKFETRINTINARHSPKYFGLKKGIVSYTLVANHIPINAKIIGANEHESHFVFDLLFNNTTDIQPDIHSTDTHGTNEVNFAILHLFGYQFAPRYKDIYDKVSSSLYGFKHPNYYQGAIKPIRKINIELIMEEWDNIQRIIVSLAVKVTTQSIIIGKLSAYARRNKTRRALWEYDNILKSLYLLEYIDSQPLRQNVQRALNRGESYHQLRRAISHANQGKLRFKTEQEQQIWSECGRLIANCILYYNAKLLSTLLSHYQSSGNVQGTEILKRISPVAWQHVNLFGRYEFRKRSEPLNIDSIVQKLAQVSVP